MRPVDQVLRDRLPAVLARMGPTSAAALTDALGTSRATLLRVLTEQQPQLVAAGAARRRRYAARRALRGRLEGIPVFRIDAAGRTHEAGALHLTQPAGSWWPLPTDHWPLPADADGGRDGWWPGLPYPLQDMRVQGYMGRQLARRHHATLELPLDPRDWSDDHHLIALTQVGSDAPGHLIVGEPALRLWQDSSPSPIAEDAAGPVYAQLAQQAVAAGLPGSSAAGEFPKFTTSRLLTGAATSEVIVKFSGAGHSPAERRWADLLVCEHLALQTLATLAGQRVAASRIVRHAGRTFLESERFDRHGPRGRSAVVSLATLDAEVLGQGGSDWLRLALGLAQLGWLDTADVQRVAVQQWFGRLIANSDMHTGNLSFIPHASGLHLAPAYDMLPMRLAPLAGGEAPPLRAEAWPMPLPAEQTAWTQAAQAACVFWQTVAGDGRIGEAMRRHAEQQATSLAQALRG